VRLRAWYAEYVASLKAVELEEWLDLVLYRPLAFGVTKVVAPTPITPNQISVASLFFGLLAGWLLWVGSTEAALLAAGSYFVCNVLDCADGQLARLRGKPSPFGYIVDGSIDYLASVAVFVGMAHHLTLQRPGEHNWYVIATLAGLSYAWQCALLDRKRHEWSHRIYDKRRDTAAEIAFFKEHLLRYREQGSHRFERFLIWVYLTYMGVWTRLTPQNKNQTAAAKGQSPALWAESNRPVLRLALLLGPTFQMSLIMVCATLKSLHVYLFGALTLGNLIGLFVVAMNLASERKLSRLTPAAEAGTEGVSSSPAGRVDAREGVGRGVTKRTEAVRAPEDLGEELGAP
jgi:phosphatidylglycerophosphate synthase